MAVPRLPRTLMRRAIWLAIGLLVLALLALATFAMPFTAWRTGEQELPPLPVEPGGPPIRPATRVWVDTDAACGQGPHTDPDDCLALLLLARSLGARLVGISTAFGNAPLEATDATTRELVAALEADGIDVPPVFRGAAAPQTPDAPPPVTPAAQALRAALRSGPLTLVALGPLTNVATALQGRDELHGNVERLVVVAGRRPGHLFHPAEGRGHGMLFGHGPVFRDFNFAQDPLAVRRILDMGLPVSLLPYDAARNVMLTRPQLLRLEAVGGAASWVAHRSEAWLAYWEQDVGRKGFYPFDVLAAAYVLDPSRFDCAWTSARVQRDRRLWGWLWGPEGLLVYPPSAAGVRTIYCERPQAGLADSVVERMASAAPPPAVQQP